MQTLKLVIGSKNLSSWSLRPWLLLKQIGLTFEEVLIPLRRPDSQARLIAASPSGKVPILVLGDIQVWDSLAICEFLAEHDPSLWPADSAARAMARSVSAEMHSGFSALRTFLPMDFTARFGPPGKLLTPVRADVERVLAIWTDCRRRYGQGGPFLFGAFSIADAMFAPVCSRFTTYAISLDPVSAEYVERMMGLPAMQEWARDAAAEVSGVPLPRPAAATTQVKPRTPPEPVAATATAFPAAEPEPAPLPEPLPARLPATFAPRVVLADEHPGLGGPPSPAPRAPEQPAAPLEPKPPPAQPRAPSPQDAPEDIRRALRPIPSTVMVKPIGDGTRRRR
jgi:glutathione S-transferase